ncbi:hypothetical protein HHL25_14155 [Rhizobium sp. S-51]|uniref:Uncharacterized protein n=1 Tax=Rhizobium terricola TaxID=2728849 RepID=A0A7Y0FWU4_9HYPH|nr:hypothetical protein [Rhizobium terricola]NML75270.1 hypothetical protein [Rhizobium terricola]
MYNRKQLCLLAGMDLDAFKQAQRVDPKTGLDDLPFLSHDGYGDDQGDAGRKTYARYTANDVLLVACAVQLAAGGGYVSKAMSFANASKIMSNQRADARAAVVRTWETRKLHFVGYAAMHDLGGANVCGTLSQIEDRLQLTDEHDFEKLYLIAPAVVVRSIEKRANEHSIEWHKSAVVGPV